MASSDWETGLTVGTWGESKRKAKRDKSNMDIQYKGMSSSFNIN